MVHMMLILMLNLALWRFPCKGGPRHRPKNIVILIMGTPKKYPGFEERAKNVGTQITCVPTQTMEFEFSKVMPPNTAAVWDDTRACQVSGWRCSRSLIHSQSSLCWMCWVCWMHCHLEHCHCLSGQERAWKRPLRGQWLPTTV